MPGAPRYGCAQPRRRTIQPGIPDGLWPTTSVGLSCDSTADREIGKHSFRRVAAVSGRRQAWPAAINSDCPGARVLRGFIWAGRVVHCRSRDGSADGQGNHELPAGRSGCVLRSRGYLDDTWFHRAYRARRCDPLVCFRKGRKEAGRVETGRLSRLRWFGRRRGQAVHRHDGWQCGVLQIGDLRGGSSTPAIKEYC